MKNKNLLHKITFAGVIFSVLMISATAIIAQSTGAPPKQEKLLNGLKVLMWSDARTDKVWVKVRIHAGSAFDPQGREGAMQLLADNLFSNEASRDFFVEDLGGSLEVVTTYDYIQVNASSKPESFLTMLETLAAAISNPAIDKETTAKLRIALMAKLKVLEADPAYVADQAVAKRLFGTFPYGRPQRGSTASVQKLGFADLIDAKARFLTADNATVAISGNYDKDVAYRALRRYFGPWLKADKKVPATFKQPDEPDTKLLKIEIPNLEKSYTRTAMVAPARGDKDYVAMQILQRNWRERYCFYDESLLGSNSYQTFLLRGIYSIANTRQTTAGLPSGSGHCELLLTNKDGGIAYPDVTQADFDMAKTKVVSDYYQKVQTLPGLADLWLDLDTFKLKSVEDASRKLNEVTLSDVNALAERLSKSKTVRVIVTASAPAK